MPAKSPGLSSMGPDVVLNPTCSSFAMMLERVVLPSPGRPVKQNVVKRFAAHFAACMEMASFSLIFFCPT